MFRVIDTIRWSEAMQRDASLALPQLGAGLLVILDPAQVMTAPIAEGSTIRVHCPDGTVTERRVDSVQVRHSVVGLFFAHTDAHEVPRDSQIELVGTA